MNGAVDPRLAARRHHVQEGWARRRMRWMLILLAVLLLAGVGVALFESPWLAVRTVNIEGAVNATVDEILAAHGVETGAPTISVRPGPVEAALVGDPWVADAEVKVTWPGSVEVTIIERAPAAWVKTPEGWVLAAVDGIVVATGTPEEGAPRVRSPEVTVDVGDHLGEHHLQGGDLVAAVEFLGRLTPELAVGSWARLTPTGIELEVAGHRVLAGNGRDVAPKVATLEAMLADGVDAGAVINVISPSRPGAFNPRAVVEGTGEDVSSPDETD